MATLFEKAGGMDGLRAVLGDFYDAVFDDVMIGFHFRNANKERLIQKEAELAARMLGASDVKYTGKPLRQAHAPHPILGGQFERRLQLLREAMEKHNLPEDVRTEWVAHTQALRSQVTRDPGSDCDHAANPGKELTIKN
jgi:hemoglobin